MVLIEPIWPSMKLHAHYTEPLYHTGLNPTELDTNLSVPTIDNNTGCCTTTIISLNSGISINTNIINGGRIF
jgi:hypothetical protein